MKREVTKKDRQAEFAALMPKCPLMALAWVDGLRWAASQEDALEAFCLQSGITIPTAARNGLEAMIDDATGVHEDFLLRFAAWWNENFWGDLSIEVGSSETQ